MTGVTGVQVATGSVFSTYIRITAGCLSPKVSQSEIPPRGIALHRTSSSGKPVSRD